MTRNDRNRAAGETTRSRRGRFAQVAAVVVFVLLTAEVGVRLIENQLPPATFGDGEELAIKRDHLRALAASGSAPDVLFVGASAVDAGVDPLRFDALSGSFTSSYNAAGVAMPVEMVLPWIEQIVLDVVEPELVVVGILPFQLGDVGTQVGGSQNVAGYRAAYEESLKKLQPGALRSLDDSLSDASALVRYRHQLRDPAEVVRYIRATITGAEPAWALAKDPALRTRAEWESLVTDRGTNLLYAAVPDAAFPDEAMAARYTAWIESGARAEPLRAMLRGLLSNGVEVVLFAPPLDRETLTESGLDFTLLDEAVDLMAQEAAALDVPFVDLFRSDYEPLDFHDKVHLNARGAERMSNDLATALDGICSTGAIDACAS